jgi:hypothetical protein
MRKYGILTMAAALFVAVIAIFSPAAADMYDCLHKCAALPLPDQYLLCVHECKHGKSGYSVPTTGALEGGGNPPKGKPKAPFAKPPSEGILGNDSGFQTQGPSRTGTPAGKPGGSGTIY